MVFPRVSNLDRSAELGVHAMLQTSQEPRVTCNTNITATIFRRQQYDEAAEFFATAAQAPDCSQQTAPTSNAIKGNHYTYKPVN